MKLNNPTPLNILLADDDIDDCFFFEKALGELSIENTLTIVRDGEQLMAYLFENTDKLPDILFLDLSMPRKTGFECLSEIKENEKLKDIAVVMFSTSYVRDINYEQNIITMLYDIGAQEYIRKPSTINQLKEIIKNTLEKIVENKKIAN